jgi:arginine exporter protein ArgO
MPILVFTAAFTALGFHEWSGNYFLTAVFVLGVFFGSALWAPILVTVVSLFQPTLTTQRVRLLNRVSGGIIFAFGTLLGLTTAL